MRSCRIQGTARLNLPQRPPLLAPVPHKEAGLHRGEEGMGAGSSYSSTGQASHRRHHPPDTSTSVPLRPRSSPCVEVLGSLPAAVCAPRAAVPHPFTAVWAVGVGVPTKRRRDGGETPRGAGLRGDARTPRGEGGVHGRPRQERSAGWCRGGENGQQAMFCGHVGGYPRPRTSTNALLLWRCLTSNASRSRMPIFHAAADHPV